MKRFLVYLHGKGDTKNGHSSFVKELAKLFDANVLSFDGPLEYKNGFMWASKHDGKLNLDELSSSANYIIKNLIDCLSSNDEIILYGHSQGGILAVCLGLTKLSNVKAIVTTSADIPYDLGFSDIINKNIPIYWIAQKNDGYLSQKRLDSYKILQAMNTNLIYILNEKSKHNVLDLSILDELKEKL